MIVKSIHLENAWGISKPMDVADMCSLNVVIGKNNSGKSNVLKAIKFVRDHAKAIVEGEFGVEPRAVFEPGYNRNREGSFNLSFSVQLSDQDQEIILANPNIDKAHEACAKVVAQYLKSEITFTMEPGKTAVSQKRWTMQIPILSSVSWEEHAGRAGADTRTFKSKVEELVQKSAKSYIANRIENRIRYIGGWRTLQDSSSHITKTLRQWRDPGTGAETKYLIWKWKSFVTLFGELAGLPDIEVNFEGDHDLTLMWDKRLLPLASYGDGFQHLLMLAFHLTNDPSTIMLIEEPETHLHPEMQRNLMRILQRESTGQVIITTHSPVLLDSFSEGCIYRVERSPHQVISRCLDASDLRHILDILDVRPSDILQANCVIWVEGPTDRMFIKRCFELLNIKRIEGVHYQFAYYGGRVRSHYAFDQLDQQQWIDVLKLCRHAIMVCDSDKKSKDASIDATKERLKKECTDTGGHYWVTLGREIENYISDAVLTRTVQRLTGKDDLKVSLEQFGDLPNALRSVVSDAENAHGLRDYGANKAKLMQEFLKDMIPEDLNQYDLKNQLKATISLVYKWSGANDEAMRVSDVP